MAGSTGCAAAHLIVDEGPDWAVLGQSRQMWPISLPEGKVRLVPQLGRWPDIKERPVLAGAVVRAQVRAPTIASDRLAGKTGRPTKSLK